VKNDQRYKFRFPVLLSDVNLFTHIGWRTADINSDELHSQSDSAEGECVFVGIGICPQQNISLSTLESFQANADIGNFYATKLRTQCLPKQVQQLEGLLSSGILKVNADKSLSVDTAYPLM
jgi:hypothetical protein